VVSAFKSYNTRKSCKKQESFLNILHPLERSVKHNVSPYHIIFANSERLYHQKLSVNVLTF